MTLTQAARLTRLSLLSFLILIILSAVGLIGYQFWYKNYYLPSLPPVEEKAEEKFGPLPPLNMPASSVSSANFSYTLDTNTGILPQNPKLIKVYFIPQVGISFLAAEKAKTLAKKLGFNQEPDILSDTEYKFTDSQGAILTINLNTANFHLQKPPSTPSAQLSPTPLPEENQLIAAFKNYLTAKDLLPNELQNGATKTTFSSSSRATSKTAEISLWPENIDQLPLVNPLFNKALVRATFINTQEEGDRFSEINYVFWPIDKSTYSTYAIKNTETAFAELKSGKGAVVVEPDYPQVSITSVHLAYYQPIEYTPYLQPVYVFEGPKFAALVSAIDYSSQNPQTPSLSRP